LTTLSMIIIKLYHLAVTHNLKKSKIEILKRKLYTPSDDGYTFFMGTNNRNETYTDIFENKKRTKEYTDDISINNIYNNFKIISEYLDEKLDTPHKVECFILYFLKRIYLIQISIPTATDVAMVFEVINARGEKLKSFEILKGELLGQIPKKELDEYLTIWNNRILLLQKEVNNPDKFIDDFFISFFKARFTKSSSDIKDFDKDYHKTILSKKWNQRLKLKGKAHQKNVKSFIKDDFNYYSKIFKDINFCFYEGSKYPHLFFNHLNGLGAQIIPILSSIPLNVLDGEVSNKINLISKLYDRHFSVLQLLNCYSSNKFTETIESLTIDIRDKDFKDIKEIFDKRLLKDINDAKSSSITEIFHYPFFKNVSKGQYTFTRYLFARVEKFLAEKIQLPVDNYYNLVKNTGYVNGYDIEHTLADNNESRSHFKVEGEFEIQRNRLGALVLLNNSVNRSSKDELYADRLKTYFNSGTLWAKTLTEAFYLQSNIHLRRLNENFNLDFKPVNSFDQNAIEDRQKLLFEIIKIIWGDKFLFETDTK